MEYRASTSTGRVAAHLGVKAMSGPMRMIPTVFGEHFGWFHEGDGPLGAVICNPMGHEAMWLHRGSRQLAQRLSEQGMPVLRFDYAGTGDSAGEPGADAMTAWMDGIAAAVTHLTSISGARRVALLGIRLGATLAAEVASRIRTCIPVDALVLLEPVVSGRAYRRELEVLRQCGKRGTAHRVPMPLGACLDTRLTPTRLND